MLSVGLGLRSKELPHWPAHKCKQLWTLKFCRVGEGDCRGSRVPRWPVCPGGQQPEGLPLGEESMNQPLLSFAELYTIPLSPSITEISRDTGLVTMVTRGACQGTHSRR